jgi:hypothetical protein
MLISLSMNAPPPIPVQAGLVLNLDSHSLNLSTGDPVTSWLDDSGYGNNFGSGVPPLYNDGADDDGIPYLDFDGSQYLVGPRKVNNPPSMTIFVVTQRSVPIGGDPVFVISKINRFNLDPGWAIAMYPIPAGQSQAQDLTLTVQNTGATPVLAPQWQATADETRIGWTADMVNRTSGTIYKNNVSTSSVANNTGVVSSYGNSEPLRLGTSGELTNPYVGRLYCVRIYTPVLSAEDRAIVVHDLNLSYAIPIMI